MTRAAYRPNEVAAMLGVDVETVRRWLVDGTLPGRKVGRIWLKVLEEMLA